MHNDKLRNLWTQPNMVRAKKSRPIWVGYVACGWRDEHFR